MVGPCRQKRRKLAPVDDVSPPRCSSGCMIFPNLNPSSPLLLPHSKFQTSFLKWHKVEIE